MHKGRVPRAGAQAISCCKYRTQYLRLWNAVAVDLHDLVGAVAAARLTRLVALQVAHLLHHLHIVAARLGQLAAQRLQLLF